jgi:hypothetical protein
VYENNVGSNGNQLRSKRARWANSSQIPTSPPFTHQT